MHKTCREQKRATLLPQEDKRDRVEELRRAWSQKHLAQRIPQFDQNEANFGKVAVQV
jgi:hypothetical protein